MFGRNIHYNIEGNLINNQKFKEEKTKIISIVILKLVSKKRVEKSITRSLFCSPSNQVLISSPRACHVLSKNDLAKNIDLLKKPFTSAYFGIFTSVNKIKNQESTPDHY